MERKRLDGRYDFATWNASVTVDIITYGVPNATPPVKPKAHAVKMFGEVERIINLSPERQERPSPGSPDPIRLMDTHPMPPTRTTAASLSWLG